MLNLLTKITISLLLMGASIEIIADKQAQNKELSLFRAVYKADYKGLPVKAHGVRELERNSNGVYTLRSDATSFIASIEESSSFTYSEGKITPIQYEYHRTGLGKDRHAVLDFNWQEKTVLNNVQSKPWRMSVSENSLDKLVYQLQMREDLLHARSENLPWPELTYEIADGGKLKHYEFEVIGEELIETPMGKINTLKIMRIKHRKNRETALWLAPDYDFLLVRLQQLEGNGKGFELLLKEAEFNGRAL